MVTYRKARPEEREAYIAFADMVFTDSGTAISFEASIPKVYGKHIDSADMQYIAIDDEKGIRGLVAVMPNTMHVGNDTLKVGYIGTVSVHPQARGEGHMKKLMQMAIEDMEKNGVDISLLGGNRQRYEYFGFAKGGVGYSMNVSEPNVRHALKNVDISGISFEEIGHDSPWVEPAHALYETQGIRFERSREAFVDCCRNYLTQLWAILENGKFAGYLVCNAKKDSFAEICVTETSMLDKVIKAWMQANQIWRINMIFPVWQKAYLRHLGSYVGGTSLEMRVQSSMINPRRVLKALLTAKMGIEKVDDGSMTFEIEGDRFTATVRDGEVKITDGGENPVVLNRLQASMLFAYPFDYEGRSESPRGWFPLPIYEASPDAF